MLPMEFNAVDNRLQAHEPGAKHFHAKGRWP
jgi:hypothetical protein